MLRQDADFEAIFLDSPLVRAYQHAAGTAKKGPQSIGRSRGRLTTKIHVCVEGLGNLAQFILTGGEVHDMTPAFALLNDITPQVVLAVKAHDAIMLIDCIKNKSVKVFIHPNANWKEPREYDRFQNRNRNVIEHFFAKIKPFRRITTQYDKLDVRFASFITLAASIIWLQ